MLTKNNSQDYCISVETSGRYGSVALGKGGIILGEQKLSGMMRHSAELFASLRRLVNDANIPFSELKWAFITIGPGSFTGLRIAVTLAKMTALVNGTKIVPVSTMDVIAANAMAIENVDKSFSRLGIILDAKRNQFYAAVFEKISNRWEKVLNDSLITAEEFKENFANQSNPILLLGEGLVYYQDKFKTEGIDFLDEKYWYPSSAKLYEVGLRLSETDKIANAATIKPLYLRQPEAVENLAK